MESTVSNMLDKTDFPGGTSIGRIALEKALESGQNFSIVVGNCSIVTQNYIKTSWCHVCRDRLIRNR